MSRASVVPKGCCPSGCVGRRQNASIPTSVIASWLRRCVLAYEGKDRPTRCRVVAAWLPLLAANRLAEQGPLDWPVVVDSTDTGHEYVPAMPRPRTSTRATPCPQARSRGVHAPSKRLGDQLGRWRRREGARPRTATGPLPPPPANHAAKHADFDVELCGRYRVASLSGVQTVRHAACDSRRGVVRSPVPTPRYAAQNRHVGSANTRPAAAIPDSHAAGRPLRRATDPLPPRAV
jgi:hypothetical protein